MKPCSGSEAMRTRQGRPARRSWSASKHLRRVMQRKRRRGRGAYLLGMTVVVTGASGHLGANLVRALLDRGERVRVLVHRSSAALAELEHRVEQVQGSVCAPDSLGPAFAGAERVYHLAGV